MITGASSGIGEAMAREFVRRGHRVVRVARHADRLAALASTLGDTASVVPVDLSRRDERAAAALSHLPRRPLLSTPVRSHPGMRAGQLAGPAKSRISRATRPGAST